MNLRRVNGLLEAVKEQIQDAEFGGDDGVSTDSSEEYESAQTQYASAQRHMMNALNKMERAAMKSGDVELADEIKSYHDNMRHKDFHAPHGGRR